MNRETPARVVVAGALLLFVLAPGQAAAGGALWGFENHPGRDQAMRPRLDHQIDKLSSENSGLESDIAALQKKIEKIEGEPAAAPPSPEPSMWTAVAWGIAGAALALLAVVAFGDIRPRLRRRALPHLH